MCTHRDTRAYIYIYRYICTCMHKHTQVHIFTCTHRYMCIHMQCTDAHAYMCTYNVRVHTHTQMHMHTCAHTQVYVHMHACSQVCMHIFNIKEIPFFILFQQYVWAYMLLAHHKPGLGPRVSEYLRGLCMAGLLITRDLSLGLPRDSLLNSAVIQASTPTLFFYPSIPTPKRTSQKSL